MDMGNFMAQVAPLFMSLILFPLVLLALVLVVRSQWKRLRPNKNPASQTAQPVASSQGSALDLLRQARSAPASEYDAGDLPDLDALVKPDTPRRGAASSPAGLREIQPESWRIKLHTGHITGAKEVLTILRDESDGRLMVQMGAVGYRTLVESPDAKKEFTRLMKELSGIIMTPDTRAEEPVVPDFLTDETESEAAPPAARLGDLARDSQPLAAPEPPQPVAKKTAPPPPLADGSVPGMLPSYKFDDNPAKIHYNRSGFVKKVDFVPPPDVDIPGAIEAYLQYKIQHTPEFQGREIHVRRAMEGGVRIQVGDTFFESVDDVADPEIRHFLKETIAEWQERQ